MTSPSPRNCGTRWSRSFTGEACGTLTCRELGGWGPCGEGGFPLGFPTGGAPGRRLAGGGVLPSAAQPPPPTCYPLVIPTSSEKVSLLLSCVKQNKRDGSVPPTFRLDSWEYLACAVSRIAPGKPLFGVHIDLKNAFWSFRPPPGARRLFRFRSGPGLPDVELERLPFG